MLSEEETRIGVIWTDLKPHDHPDTPPHRVYLDLENLVELVFPQRSPDTGNVLLEWHPHPSPDKVRGLPGPNLRSEVGDRIMIMDMGVAKLRDGIVVGVDPQQRRPSLVHRCTLIRIK